MKLPVGAFMRTELILKQMFRLTIGVWNKSISEFSVFQVPGVQNNQYTKVHIWGWLFQLPFSCKEQDGLTHLSESCCCLSLVTTYFSQLSLAFHWARPLPLYDGLGAAI